MRLTCAGSAVRVRYRPPQRHGLRRVFFLLSSHCCGAYQKIVIYCTARQRPWLSLWESCQPNRLTERVLRLMVGQRPLERGPLSVCPYGAASSPKGRAKVASLRRNDTAKFQFLFIRKKRRTRKRMRRLFQISMWLASRALRMAMARMGAKMMATTALKMVAGSLV